MSGLMTVSDEVAAAVAAGRPVVALETTLVTHGLPQPDGMRVAVALEEAVRARGALPATIGILDGGVRVGITRAELERLASAPNPVTVNLGNFAAEVAAGGCGSTTSWPRPACCRRRGGSARWRRACTTRCASGSGPPTMPR